MHFNAAANRVVAPVRPPKLLLWLEPEQHSRVWVATGPISRDSRHGDFLAKRAQTELHNGGGWLSVEVHRNLDTFGGI